MAALSSAREARGQRDAMLAQMRSTGRGGAGMEAQALMSGAQGAANRASERGMTAAMAARQNAINALLQQSQLSSQDTELAQRKAQAQDAMNQYNQNAMANYWANKLGMQNQFTANLSNAGQTAGAQAGQTAGMIGQAISSYAGK
jgi:hypothetical protein